MSDGKDEKAADSLIMITRRRPHRQYKEEDGGNKCDITNIHNRNKNTVATTTTKALDAPTGAGNLNDGPSVVERSATVTPSTANRYHLFDPFFGLRMLMDAITYITLLAMASLIAYGLRPQGVGILLLGILPSAFILYMLQQSYHSYVLKSQMVWTFFRTVWWMSLICESSIVQEIISYSAASIEQ